MRRTRRLMRGANIVAKATKRFRKTTDSQHSLQTYDNKLDRNFYPVKPNQAWVSDITYVWTDEGFLYVAVFLDLFSRKVIGWSMKNHMRADLITDAFDAAIKQRSPDKNLLVHSDQGSQYASYIYQDIINHHGFTCSMSRKGNCWDNAPAESFFKTLKLECINGIKFLTIEEAKQTIFDYIEIFYNRKRLHTSVGCRPPVEVEASYVSL